MLKFFTKKVNFIALLSLYLIWVQPSYANSLKIYTSIKPLQGITIALMDKIDVDIDVIIPDTVSPHRFLLTPRIISKLNHSDLLIWIGPQLEMSLKKYFESTKGNQLKLIKIEDLKIYSVRHLQIHDLNDEVHSHDHHNVDGHIWLSSDNGILIAKKIAEKLIILRPEFEKQIKINLQNFIAKIVRLKTEIKIDSDVLYFVMHDAYQYFEHDYQLRPKAVVHMAPGYKPSAKHLISLVTQAKQYGRICLFLESQLGNDLSGFFEQYSVFEKGILDPMGLKIKMDKFFYYKLLLSLSEQYQSCFKSLEKSRDVK